MRMYVPLPNEATLRYVDSTIMVRRKGHRDIIIDLPLSEIDYANLMNILFLWMRKSGSRKQETKK